MNRALKDCLRTTLSKDHICYVVVACKNPSLKGEMEVVMLGEGDIDLTCLLLEGALNHFEDKK